MRGERHQDRVRRAGDEAGHFEKVERVERGVREAALEDGAERRADEQRAREHSEAHGLRRLRMAEEDDALTVEQRVEDAQQALLELAQQVANGRVGELLVRLHQRHTQRDLATRLRGPHDVPNVRELTL